MKLLIKILKVSPLFIGLLVILVALLFGHQDISLEDLKAKYAKAPSLFLSMKGMDVHYRDEGDPNDLIPIVLIHGTGSSLHTFDNWTAQLKNDYRVIRMDLPAYGLTGPSPDRDYSINNYVDFLHDFLTSLGVTECILGGNSLGGNITWNFSIKYPGMVQKLILIDAAGYPAIAESEPIAFKMAKIPIIKNIFTFITPRSVAEKSVNNVFADKSKVTEELVDRYFELTLREGNRQAFVDRLGIEKDPNASKNIKSIQQKTLIIWGDQDELIPVENAYKFHDDLINDTLVVVNGAGHLPMEESPKESLIALLSFLKD